MYFTQSLSEKKKLRFSKFLNIGQQFFIYLFFFNLHQILSQRNLEIIIVWDKSIIFQSFITFKVSYLIFLSWLNIFTYV